MVVNKLLDFINNQLEKKRLSHVFLLETNNTLKCYKDVCEVVKYLNCPHSYNRDCKQDCNLCHLVDNESLPSLFKVEPDGATIKKEQIINLKEKLSYKAVYTKYNSYIILEADKLNASSANTMLKFLEEPEENIMGFLITNNIENIMVTIKSRCQIFKVFYDEENIINNDMQSIAQKYLEDVILQKGLEVNRLSLVRDEVTSLFNVLLNIVRENIINGNDISYVTKKEQKIKLMTLIENILQKIKYNVNLDMLLDSFYIEVGCILNE